MLKIMEGHKKDMYFVYRDKPTDDDNEGYEIVKIFYTPVKAQEYINENQRIGARYG